MKQESTYQPDWINEQDVMKWLGVGRTTLYNWRKSKGLAWAKVGRKTLMYDRKQIEKMLNDESSYKYMGVKLSVA